MAGAVFYWAGSLTTMNAHWHEIQMPSERAPSRESRGGIPAWWFALLGVGLVWVGWFAPTWCAPVSALVVLAVLLFSPRARAGVDWSEVAIAAAVPLVLCAKDLLFSGPLGKAAVAHGLAEGVLARQPDAAAALHAAALAGLCVVVFIILRGWASGERGPAAWMRGVALGSAVLAAAVLTAPGVVSDYGLVFQLGEVRSRNAASGAFALSAIISIGWVAVALHEGRRTWEWATGAACAVVCTSAVALLGSRGGLLALLAGGLYQLAHFSGKRIRRRVMLAGGVAIGALLLAPATFARLADLRGEYRLELWEASMRVLMQAPWGGLGGGSFAEAFALFGGLVPTEGARVTHPDSSWVMWLVEWGVVGVVVSLIIIFRFIRKDAGAANRSRLQITAEAGVVAWALAAIGDVSFHRTALLVVGVPLLAIARPAHENRAGTIRPAWVLALVVFLCAGVASGRWWDDEPVGPWDMQGNHRLGYTALARGDSQTAARHFLAVVTVDSANVQALGLYGRTLMPVAPELALEFWKRLFSAANDLAPGLLDQELSRGGGGAGPVYWMRALEKRPELWVAPADADEPAAQRCFDQWRALAPETRARSPWGRTLGAMARWGTVADLEGWLAVAPEVSLENLKNGAHMLRSRKRDDLAWTWLSHRLPEPGWESVAEEDAGLKGRVLANPSDFVAAARLVGQTRDPDERLKLLERIAARSDAPAAFLVRLAYVLRENGRRAEALDRLQAAAGMAVGH